MRRRTYLFTAAGGLALAAGCTSLAEEEEEEREPLPESVTVEIEDGQFSPLLVQVAVGGTVTWENTSDESYRIDSYQFHSGSEAWTLRESLEPGESFSHTFDEEGRYDYTDQARGQFAICGRILVGHVEEGSSLPCQ